MTSVIGYKESNDKGEYEELFAAMIGSNNNNSSSNNIKEDVEPYLLLFHSREDFLSENSDKRVRRRIDFKKGGGGVHSHTKSVYEYNNIYFFEFYITLTYFYSQVLQVTQEGVDCLLRFDSPAEAKRWLDYLNTVHNSSSNKSNNSSNSNSRSNSKKKAKAKVSKSFDR